MSDLKNEGPNFLKAWRKHHRMTLEQVADQIGTTASVVTYLESGQRVLSAKWLRRIAPVFGITPGILLDHHPDDVSADMIEIWTSATTGQKQQITDMARILLNRNGTDG